LWVTLNKNNHLWVNFNQIDYLWVNFKQKDHLWVNFKQQDHLRVNFKQKDHLWVQPCFLSFGWYQWIQNTQRVYANVTGFEDNEESPVHILLLTHSVTVEVFLYL